jgi:hypothetical protein
MLWGLLDVLNDVQNGPLRRQSPSASNNDAHKRRNSVMTKRYLAIWTGALLGAIALAGNAAQALTMTECSAKYKAAQTAGTLKGMKWNDFRKAECGPDAAAAPAATAKPAAPVTAAKPAAPATTGALPAKPAETATAKPAARGNAVFPNAVSPKYSSESAGKARMHTCLDQYNANKASNGNGGLTWIQKGGGYYSECNRRLKS